jgi:membrane protease YdiL (CAAX protease family)
MGAIFRLHNGTVFQDAPLRTEAPAVRSFPASAKPWLYFGLTLAWSWACFIPATLLGRSVTEPPVLVLFVLGSLGPALAALVLLYTLEAPEARRDYWKRLVDVRRIGTAWWVLLLLPLVCAGLGALSYWLEWKSLPMEAAARRLASPLALAGSALFFLLFGPLPEEMGWRGYALDRLQNRWSALAASGIIGVVWAVWHLPMFFVKGTYQHSLGVGTPRFYFFLLALLPESVLLAWIYASTNRSTLAAVLFHFMTSFTGEVLQLPGEAEAWRGRWTVLAAAVVVFLYGARTLRRPRARLQPAAPPS